MQLFLPYGLNFDDLYRRDGLARIDALFLEHLQEGDVALYNRLLTARRDPAAVAGKEESDLIIDLAPHLEDFLGALFGIGGALCVMQERHHELAPLYAVKR